jgi:tRNA(Ile)-lysidine synthase
MRRIGRSGHELRRALLASVRDLWPDDLMLVACSGGPDSLALAAVAAATDRRAGAVIVDHRMQQDSAPVAARAARQCRDLGLDPVLVRAVTVPAGTGGREASARKARYDALQAAASDTGAAAVLLAHTRDDQAESVLLGLARGSGNRSLAGMPAVRGIFRRPWLTQPRSLIIAALLESGLQPWEDPHNTDRSLLRSRVRHQVLPVLEAELGPGIAGALARTAELARQDADALDGWADSEQRELGDPPWPVDGLAALPAAVRTRLLRSALIAAGAAATDLTAKHVADVDRLVTDWHGQGPVTAPGGVTATRRYGRLAVSGTVTRIGVADGAG